MDSSGRDRISRRLRGPLLASALLVLPLAEAEAKFPPEPGKDPGCTVAEPTARVTLELVALHSADLCPMLAYAVGKDVLHARVGMSPALWHYAGARRSCRLHLAAKPTPNITVYNSRQACRWLTTAGWVRIAVPT